MLGMRHQLEGWPDETVHKAAKQFLHLQGWPALCVQCHHQTDVILNTSNQNEKNEVDVHIVMSMLNVSVGLVEYSRQHYG